MSDKIITLRVDDSVQQDLAKLLAHYKSINLEVTQSTLIRKLIKDAAANIKK